MGLELKIFHLGVQGPPIHPFLLFFPTASLPSFIGLMAKRKRREKPHSEGKGGKNEVFWMGETVIRQTSAHAVCLPMGSDRQEASVTTEVRMLAVSGGHSLGMERKASRGLENSV